MHVSLRVNGVEWSGEVEPRLLLADFLRDRLSLTGTHLGCEHGVCGACTVLLDGEPVRSCLMLAVQADGGEVTTVEGLGTPESPSDLQRAFVEHGALQCGFCTPGFLMTGEALRRSGRALSDGELRGYLAGHICRCTGYEPIVAAFSKALGQQQEDA